MTFQISHRLTIEAAPKMKGTKLDELSNSESIIIYRPNTLCRTLRLVLDFFIFFPDKILAMNSRQSSYGKMSMCHILEVI